MNYTGTHRDDQSLLSLWKSGDETAFACLYRRYFPLLVTTAYQKTKDRYLAEELAQESLLAFYYKKEYQLDNVAAYLQVILRHKTYDHFRKVLVREQHTTQAARQQPATVEDTTQQLYRTDLLKALQQKVQALPDQCRTVFLLSRDQHMSNHEIAHTLGISVNTVEQHMRKALKRLREGILLILLISLYK
ncbi:RNA polymerase sigma factor [Chitinophaga qingshengii]|uniref:RNA polymerase sigma-70 factor n=1 Tax=Chitinophaga qingshengii TaxID=1569794 RepID=A0ABR7TQ37_9BACT|nr:RNA polymerase sigma-70 factor [Chitinophaga qingshengii]MBC9932085.1 RNA polymerase sigma-70 factor [Chitinophaga qingshengii]